MYTDTLFPYTTLFRSALALRLRYRRSQPCSGIQEIKWAPCGLMRARAPSADSSSRAGIEPSFVEDRSEGHTSELQSLMRISYAVFCLKKKTHNTHAHKNINQLRDNKRYMMTPNL